MQESSWAAVAPSCQAAGDWASLGPIEQGAARGPKERLARSWGIFSRCGLKSALPHAGLESYGTHLSFHSAATY